MFLGQQKMHVSGPAGLNPVKLVFSYKDTSAQGQAQQKTAVLYFNPEAGKLA